ncbi:D-2-hydroxyacid dehydrogenase [Jannaschia pagri]|uniref:D-2-hydroxyacid dehydrogenase n=1 Tax=Jannaschia pagri TaxID=2829797 RepID=A0ABQ4NKD4_9RHOB|nr:MULTISPECIES: FAD-binding oxidoreductase [unclassified Jannaschia]GIT91030.1 D-2-hydroxyacid dehydrogenase [Jannaschia sp. AI_61]GIT94862.1 D-2-hydroxyacid dehydrogenase [Jannaschia sp. AI_62]
MTYQPATGAFADSLRADLPQAVFRPLDPRYTEEPRGRWAGSGGLLLAPSTTAEVARIVQAAGAAGVPIVPYGGGTGLVGGQVSGDLSDPIILSLERMSQIRSVDPVENAMVAEAGVILQWVQEAAEQANRLFPLSIAAQGSARIGGVLSTNAGGVNVLRYGNARDLCLGLEAVLPDGSILNGLSPLRKNNTGYDLRHLLIGAEGTLGIITAATLKLVPRPARTGAAMMVVRDPAAALDLLNLARDRIGEGVSAFELIGGMGLGFLAETMPEVRLPLGQPDWSVLIDLGLGASGDPQQALEGLFEAAAERDLVHDGAIAQSEQQRADFWRVRESIPAANRKIGAVSSHDISVPIAAIPRFIAEGPAAIAAIGSFRINCFGHVGDGNLHYNVFPIPGRSRADHEGDRDAIKRAVHDLVHAHGGSVSAEHGVGRLKVADLERYVDPTKLTAMRAIKAALDPKGVMNPGAVLRHHG